MAHSASEGLATAHLPAFDLIGFSVVERVALPAERTDGRLIWHVRASTTTVLWIMPAADLIFRTDRHQIGIMIRMEDRTELAIVAVPPDAVRELEREGLALRLPVLRGAVLDAAVTVGMDSAALVTLLQAPDSIRAFAVWIRDRCARSGNSIELSARRAGRRVRLRVDGDIDVGVVANFLVAAFADDDSQP